MIVFVCMIKYKYSSMHVHLYVLQKPVMKAVIVHGATHDPFERS